MNNKLLEALIGLATVVFLLAGCGSQETAPTATSKAEIPLATSMTSVSAAAPTIEPSTPTLTLVLPTATLMPEPTTATPTPVPPTATLTPEPPTNTPTISSAETLIFGLGDADRDMRIAAAKSLEELGPGANEAVPDLVKTLVEDQDWFVRFASAEALGKIGVEAVPALTQVLEEGSGDVAFLALMALREIGSEAEEAIPSLVSLLGSEDTLLLSNAAETFRFVGPVPKEVISSLVQKMGDAGDISEELDIASALVAIGSDAVPQLVEALGDEDQEIQDRAAWTLGEMGADAKEAVPALIGALPEKWAIEALGDIGPEAKEAAPLLLQMAEEDSISGPELNVLIALGQIGTEEAIAFLNEKIVDSQTKNVERSMAAMGLAEGIGQGSLTDEATDRLIGSLADTDTLEWLNLAGALLIQATGDEQVVSALIDALEHPSRDVRGGAAWALAYSGGHEEAVPALLEAVHDKDAGVRQNAARALGTSGVASDEVLSALIDALNDEEDYARMGAMEGLGWLGPPAKEAVTPLVELALHGNKEGAGGQTDAIEALAGIGAGAGDAVTDLTSLLQEDDPEVRRLAARALGAVGPGAEEAIPQLLEMLHDEDNSARVAAAVALANIQPDTEEPIPVLVQMLGDHEQDSADRYSVARTLGRLAAEVLDRDAHTWLEMWGAGEEEQ